MKNKEYTIEETIKALVQVAREKSVRDGEINYGHFSGSLQAYLETLGIVGEKTFCEINKKTVDAFYAS